MSKGARPRPLEGLTGLRFFAAFAVVLYHYGEELFPWAWARRVVHGGYSAVSMFFVLSGFVLTYNYADTFERREITRRSFWLARLARVYPLYLLLVLLEVPLFLFVFHAAPARTIVSGAVAHVFLLQSWMAGYVRVGNVPGWTIGNEAFFYLIFPWLVVRLYRSNRRSTLVLSIVATWVLGMAYAIFHNGALAPLYAALIYGLAHEGAPARLLGAAPLVALGEASYAVYLVQQPVFLVLLALGAPIEGTVPRLAYFGVLVSASIVVHHGVERPLQRWIRRGPWRKLAERGDLRRDLLWLGLPALVAAALVPYGYPAWASASSW